MLPQHEQHSAPLGQTAAAPPTEIQTEIAPRHARVR